MGSLSKQWSFPRKRESSPFAAHFQRLAEWIPAFAELPAPGSARISQMTPVPTYKRQAVGVMAQFGIQNSILQHGSSQSWFRQAPGKSGKMMIGPCDYWQGR